MRLLKSLQLMWKIRKKVRKCQEWFQNIATNNAKKKAIKPEKKLLND